MVRTDAWLDAIGGTEFLVELRRLGKAPVRSGLGRSPLPPRRQRQSLRKPERSDPTATATPATPTSRTTSITRTSTASHPASRSPSASQAPSAASCSAPTATSSTSASTSTTSTAPQREAVIIRDRLCRDEGCGLPGRDCQIDHLIPRAKAAPPPPRTATECRSGHACPPRSLPAPLPLMIERAGHWAPTRRKRGMRGGPSTRRSKPTAAPEADAADDQRDDDHDEEQEQDLHSRHLPEGVALRPAPRPGGSRGARVDLDQARNLQLLLTVSCSYRYRYRIGPKTTKGVSDADAYRSVP